MFPVSDYWCALYVRPRHEKSVKKLLDFKGYQTSLPLRKCYHTRRAGAEWESEKPLLSGYVFAVPDTRNPFPIVTTPGVLQILGAGTAAGNIPAEEIEALERIATSQLPVAQCAYTRVGESVKLIRGPLKGVQGKVVRESGLTQLVISIDLLQRSLAVEIENTWAVPLQYCAAM